MVVPQYPACKCSSAPLVCYNKKRSDCAEVHRTDFNFMGYSIRTAGIY